MRVCAALSVEGEIYDYDTEDTNVIMVVADNVRTEWKTKIKYENNIYSSSFRLISRHHQD